MRNLVSQQVVKEVLPIEGADRIELVTYQDVAWQNVSLKGEFKPGNIAVYFEIDSLIPRVPEFEFLGEERDFKYLDSLGRRCFRLKSKRMKGVLSQGLALRLDLFTISADREVVQAFFDSIEKYEPAIPAQLAGVVRSTFPTDVLPKTDEDRLQSNLKYLELLYGRPWSITQKMDGSSFTCLIKDDEFWVCSRKQALKESNENSFWKIARRYDLEIICREHNVVIQGELCGPGIQKNPLGLSELELFMFNVFTLEDKFFLSNSEIMDFCDITGLTSVPLVSSGDSFSWDYPTLQQLSDTQRYPNGHLAEGIVIRLNETQPITEKKISFKVISNSYLLGGNE